MKFPMSDGDNPGLWQSRSENYFGMYHVAKHYWVKVTSMHFSGPTARWLQSIDSKLH